MKPPEAVLDSTVSSFRCKVAVVLLAVTVSAAAQTEVKTDKSSPALNANARAARDRVASDPRMALETSEALFSTLAAINMCGYDADLSSSDPLRNQVRNDIAHAIQQSVEAASARDQLCHYYKDKQQPDHSRELSQYVSFALYLNGPPAFALSIKEADLPPDAYNLIGIVPYLQRFYDAAGLHQIWHKYQPYYEAQLARLHDPVSDMLQKTDLYLKLPLTGYLGRRFVIYVEPLASPGQVNARNYGPDYFLVVSPSNGAIRMDDVRHTYLHYTLDPLALKRANLIKRIEPLLDQAKTAPVDESYKQDASLMLEESFIRAIEARTLGADAGGKGNKDLGTLRNNAAQSAMEQGYILTRYFYDALLDFEKGPTGLKDAFGDLLRGIDLGKEKKRISEIKFADHASPELVQSTRGRHPQMLDLAEQKLAENDPQMAYKIAQQVFDQQSEDPARALFIMARAATLKTDVEGARVLFERTLEVAREPRTVAWSHIYLGRILDRRCSREQALSHYRAALDAGDNTPDTKSAADKGIQVTPPGCEQDKDQ